MPSNKEGLELAKSRRDLLEKQRKQLAQQQAAYDKAQQDYKVTINEHRKILEEIETEYKHELEELVVWQQGCNRTT